MLNYNAPNLLFLHTKLYYCLVFSFYNFVLSSDMYYSVSFHRCKYSNLFILPLDTHYISCYTFTVELISFSFLLYFTIGHESKFTYCGALHRFKN